MAYTGTTRPPTGPRRPARSGSPLGIALGIIAAIAAVWLIWVWAADDEDDLYEGEVAQVKDEREQGPSVENISENPQQFIGRTVTLQGEIAESVGAQAFKIEGDDPLFADELLVIGTGQMAQLGEDERVQVTGTVQAFNRERFETEYGLELDVDLFDDFEGKPAVIADQVQPAGTARR